MSNTIPPLLNSSPPPIVGPLDDFDNDEFGDFNSARDSSFDFDVLPFPYNTPQISSHIIDHVSNGISNQNKDGFKGSLNEEHQASEIQSDTDIKKQVSNEQSTDNVENSFKLERTNSPLNNNISSINEFTNTEFNDDLVKNNVNIEETKKVDINNEEPNCDTIVSETSQSESEVNENDNEENNCLSGSYKFKQDDCDDQLREETLESVNSSQEDKYALNSQGVENIKGRIESPHVEISQENEEICDSNEVIIESVANDREIQEVDIVPVSEIKSNEGEEHKEIGNSFENFDEETGKFDDFANFNDHITTNTFSSDVVKDEQNKQDDDFDDFADFSSASNLSAATDPEVETSIFTFPKLEEIETIIKEFFPLKQEQDVVDYFPENSEKNDVILTQIRDITDTKALVYKWAKSNSQSSLFKALNIDMRNILYGPRWSETMPPFAATLGFVPLEPVKSDSTVVQTGQETSTSVLPNAPTDHIVEKETIDDVPSAQFDWNLAGLTNPLDSQSSNSLKGLKLSNEKTENITFGDVTVSKISDDTSVKSLNFNEITTDYDSLGQINKSTTHAEEDEFGDFEGFTSYPYPVNENVKEIPLRETHISNQIPITSESVKNSPVQVDNDSEFSSWVEVNSLSNTQLEAPQSNEDDFDDFQASSPPKQEIKSAPSPHQLHSSDDNEVPQIKNSVISTSSTLPLEPLIPTQITSNYTCLTPLQPIPASSNVQAPPKIEWPEPGISGQDLDDIELSYKPKIFLEKEEQQDSENSPKQPAIITTSVKEKKSEEEDDWSDFISGENASNIGGTKTSPMIGLPGKPKAELQLSISQLNRIQPPRKPTPVITHQGLYMSGGYQSPSSVAMQMTPIPTQSRPLRHTFPNTRPTSTDFQPSLISNQYAKQVETLNFGHQHNMYSGIGVQQQTFAPIAPTTPQKNEGGVNDDEEWSDFVSSRPAATAGPPPPTSSTNGWSFRDMRAPNWPATNITPNIITNPVAFDSFHNYATAGTKSKGGGNGTIGGVNASPFVPGVATSVPELDFVVPKSRTWKK